MTYTEQFRQTLEANIPNCKELMYDFFITFSRFESALQNTGRFIIAERGEANWDLFAASIKDKFNPKKSSQVADAVDYIINNPPMKIAEKNGKLVWEQSVRGKKEPIAYCLNIYIRRIRNNVLHGGKFKGKYTPESRNFQLITHALIILNDWLEYDVEVRENFLARIL